MNLTVIENKSERTVEAYKRDLDGYLDYNIIYMKNYRRFKETVDEILTLDGKQDLIKPDPNKI